TLRGIEERLLFVTWVYPRPAEIILAGHGITLESDSILDLKAYPSASECHQAILEKLSSDDKPFLGDASIREMHADVCERWYPVIDSSLCANCGNCLQFCIFNVYTYDESHRVTATNPDNCKTGCPACSRICPEGAIIFPLYNKDSAISGAPGSRMSPDAAARKMFYMRTKKQCPECHQVSDDSRTRNQNAGTRICDECGSPIDTQPETGHQLDQDAINDIDLLIDDLEKTTRRRS
ncbi:MAG: ATP-binding protein, partial [Armatimonadota bacterium]